MRILFSLALVFSLLSCATTSHKTADSFKLRKYETQVLANGLTIMWIPDNTLPYVSMQMLINAGSSQDPAGKEGLAGLVGAMIDQGTKRRTAIQIADDLEQIGSSFSVGVEPDYTIASVSTLSFHKDTALEMFQELMLQPNFPAKELERQRRLILAGLQKLADRPDDFAGYLMPRFLFGNHPYGHNSEGRPGSVRALNRKDIESFFRQYYTPSHAALAVVGQFDSGWRNKVVQAFSNWKPSTTAIPDVPDFPQWKGLETLLVNRGDLNQAQIQIGFKGVPRNIPEYMELRAALKILGESFGSRLFEEIRVRRGLTYGIYSWFDPRLKPGPMGISTFTRVDKVGETVEHTLQTYRAFVKDGVTDKEVAMVKELMKGQFPRTFETPEALARQLLLLRRYGVGPEYLTDYLATLETINKDKVNATIRKYFDTNNLRILVYAPKDKAEETLKKFGKLEVKDYKQFLQ